MPYDWPVMFRAGRAEAAMYARIPTTAPHAATAGPSVFLADISEFQPQIADAAYLAWSKAIIIRCAYGDAHDDHAWYGGQRRDLLHQGGVRFLGIYQYIVAGQDIAAQAQAVIRLVGQLRPGEKIIADIEEGSGSQKARWDTWSKMIEDALGDSPWDYSGLFFSQSSGLSPVDWVAAYGQSEPIAPHKLWQFTDSFTVPGVGVADCSIWHGTIDELAAQGYQGGGQVQTAPGSGPVQITPGPQPGPAWQESMMNSLPLVATAQDISARGLTGAVSQDLPGQTWFVRRVQSICKGMSDPSWLGLGAVADIAVDGDYGRLSKAAVQAVQGHYGLLDDGIVGPQTWAALYTA